MNLNRILSPLRAFRGALLVSVIGAVPVTMQAVPPTFWTGPSILFTQDNSSVSAPKHTDVIVLGAVALDRGVNNRLFNFATEQVHGATSPTDTEWATATPGVIADLTTAASLTYTSFDTWVGGHAPGAQKVAPFIIGKHAVLHLINENTYIAIDFSAWGVNFSGGFAYTRSTPAAVAPPPSPTVSITNPINNAAFSAPANVKLGATAAVTGGGTVTNVTFFNGATSLGSVPASPFNVTANGLAAGAYTLTAVATAGGISTTSAVVNFSVVAPVPVTTSAPGITNGQFTFSYSVTPGLSYVVQNSSNLVNWLPLVTNTPVSSPVTVSDTFNSNSVRFYRVGQLPNP